MERRVLAAVALTLPFILVANAFILLVWRGAGRVDPPPAEWVSAIAAAIGLLLAWTPWISRVARLLPGDLDHAARRRPAAAVIVGAFAMLAVVQTARVSAFMVDGSLGRDAALPAEGDHDHQCLPAYLQAAELSRAGEPNVYDEAHYEAFASKELLSLLPPRAYANVGAEDAMHKSAVRIDTERERDIFGALRCTCGCSRDPRNLLSTCSCSVAEQQREKLRARIYPLGRTPGERHRAVDCGREA